MVNWLDDLPAASEKYKREHPEQYDENGEPLAPLQPLGAPPLPDRKPVAV